MMKLKLMVGAGLALTMLVICCLAPTERDGRFVLPDACHKACAGGFQPPCAAVCVEAPEGCWCGRLAAASPLGRHP